MIHTKFGATMPAPFVRSALYHYSGYNSGGFPHTHATFQFTYVLDGRFHVEFHGGDHIVLESGQMILIAPGLKHLWYSEHDMETRALALFCGGVKPDIFGQLSSFLGPQVKSLYWLIKFPFGRAEELTEQILHVEHSAKHVKTGMLYGLHCTMLAEFGEALIEQYGTPEGNIPPNLVEVLYLIEAKYSQTLPLDELAETAGLSVSRFSALFKQHFQESPIHYLNRFRLDKACDLLRFADLPVHEVAEQCGFSSVHYFCRQFKRQMRNTPAQFRRDLDSLKLGL